jgi:hypothetical protein
VFTPVGEFLLRVGEKRERMMGNLTKGFNGCLGSKGGLVMMRSKRWQWSSCAMLLEYGEAKQRVTRVVVVSGGARGTFYRPACRAEGPGGRQSLTLVEFYFGQRFKK